MPKKPIDKEAIIADLQEKLVALQKSLDYQKRETKSAEDRADENFKNGRAWKDAVDNAERARKDSLANERAANEKRLVAEKQLSFAEGYIAALRGEEYRAVPEEGVW